MPEYGITPAGLHIKRMDEILEEINEDMSNGLGFNTRLNPKSYLAVQNHAFADKIAELWEFGAQIYHNLYPSSAEGMSLDFAAQFGGSVRERAAKTVYPIHCTCIEGTVLAKGTMISSDTNPSVQFTALSDMTATRASFNRAVLKVVAQPALTAYTIAIDGVLYSYTPQPTSTEEQIFRGLAEAMKDSGFDISIQDGRFSIASRNTQTSHSMALTENLTTENITYIANFASEEYGEVVLPDRAITKIVTAVTGFLSCSNLCGYIAGRLRETDMELRKSYTDKIFNRSTRMLDSIRSRILSNCQGIKAVAAYENDTNIEDDAGRPPHSIEIVVDGGSEYEIAQEIWAAKSGGITTFGKVEVELPDAYDGQVTVRFNRPVYLYTWIKAAVTIGNQAVLPPNYADLIKEIILDGVDGLQAGENVVPQKFVSSIHTRVPGIAYLDIAVFSTHDSAQSPTGYPDRIAEVTPRERAVTSSTRIEVVLDG